MRTFDRLVFHFPVVAACFTSIALAVPLATLAADAEPSHKASPDIYKLVSENEHFRVFEVTWKPGQRDAWHSHPGPLTSYALTDCDAMRTYTPDGKAKDGGRKAGTVIYNPIIASHSVENVGKSDCKVLIVEKK